MMVRKMASQTLKPQMGTMMKRVALTMTSHLQTRQGGSYIVVRAD